MSAAAERARPRRARSWASTAGRPGDGCGGSLDCGTCTAPPTCGGGGVPGLCGGATCTASTCASSTSPAARAAMAAATLNCGTCVAPQTCGGGGVPGPAGRRLHPAHVRAASEPTAAPGDGCGGTIDCGTCGRRRRAAAAACQRLRRYRVATHLKHSHSQAIPLLKKRMTRKCVRRHWTASCPRSRRENRSQKRRGAGRRSPQPTSSHSSSSGPTPSLEHWARQSQMQKMRPKRRC